MYTSLTSDQWHETGPAFFFPTPSNHLSQPTGASLQHQHSDVTWDHWELILSHYLILTI